MRYLLLSCLYIAALVASVYLGWQVTREYFPGGVFWLGPGLIVVGTFVLIGFDVALRRAGANRSVATTIALIGLTVLSPFVIFAHLLLWVIPNRMEDCYTYQSPCDDEARQKHRQRRADDAQF